MPGLCCVRCPKACKMTEVLLGMSQALWKICGLLVCQRPGEVTCSSSDGTSHLHRSSWILPLTCTCSNHSYVLSIHVGVFILLFSQIPPGLFDFYFPFYILFSEKIFTHSTKIKICFESMWHRKQMKISHHYSDMNHNICSNI